MKFIAASILVMVVVVNAQLTVEQLRKLAAHRKECIAETGVDPKEVSDAARGVIADDPKLNEHIFCVYKKTGFIDDAGNVQNDVIEKKLTSVVNDKELVDTIIKECSLKKETPQLTSLESYKCYFAKTGFAII